MHRPSTRCTASSPSSGRPGRALRRRCARLPTLTMRAWALLRKNGSSVPVRENAPRWSVARCSSCPTLLRASGTSTTPALLIRRSRRPTCAESVAAEFPDRFGFGYIQRDHPRVGIGHFRQQLTLRLPGLVHASACHHDTHAHARERERRLKTQARIRARDHRNLVRHGSHSARRSAIVEAPLTPR